MMDCPHRRQYELERLIFCQKRHDKYFAREDIRSFMSKRGLERPQKVRMWEIFRRSFRFES
jgi:hypothetical protein